MKIGMPTMDGQTISEHFGRCKAFLVFEVDKGVIVDRQERVNAQGGGEPHDCGGRGHDHGAFVTLLSDCEAVIVRGMGPGASRAMQRAGKRVYQANASATPEEAVFRLLSGGLAPLADGSCAGH